MNIRDKIIFAYSEMAVVYGFYRISMDELSVRAGVSKRTIYRYFESKEAIIEAVIDNFLTRVGREMDEVISSDAPPEEMLSRIMNIFFRIGRTIINPLVMNDLRTHYPNFWKKIDDYRMTKIHLVIQAVFQQNGEGRIRDFDPRIVSTIIITSIQTILNPEFILSNNLNFEDAVYQLIEFIKHGLLEEKE